MQFLATLLRKADVRHFNKIIELFKLIFMFHHTIRIFLKRVIKKCLHFACAQAYFKTILG